MEEYNNFILDEEGLWVSWNYLENIKVPFQSINSGCSRNRQGIIKTWVNRPSLQDKRKKEILYKSIPGRTAKKYKLPEEQQLISDWQAWQELEAQRLLKEQEEAQRAYDEAKLQELLKSYSTYEDMNFYKALQQEYKGITDRKAVEMGRSYTLLKMCADFTDKQKVADTFQAINNITDFRKAIIAMIQQAKDSNPQAFTGLDISNPRAFARKFSQFMETKESDRRMLLVHGQYKNRHRKGTVIGQVGMTEHEIIWIGLWENYGRSAKYTKETVYSIYESICEDRKMSPRGFTTMKGFLNRLSTRILTAREREGYKAFNDHYSPYISALRSKKSLSIVSMDGGVLGIYYKFYNERGRCVTRKRLNMVFLSDHHTSAVIGFHISDTETGDAARRAVKMAWKVSGYHRGLELIRDNGSAFNNHLTRQLVEVVFEKDSPIKVGNSQQNPAEGMVRIIEQRFSSYEGWVGENITSQGTLRPNPDYFPKEDNLMTREEVIRAVIEEIEAYNSEVLDCGRSRMQAFHEDINPLCEQVDQEMALRANRLRSKPVKVNRGEISFTVDGKQRLYAADNFYEMAKYIDDRNKGKVVLYYDDDCPEYIQVYNYDPKHPDNPDYDRFIEDFEEKGKTAKGWAEQTEETKESLGKQIKRRDDMRKQVEEENAEIQELFEQEIDLGEVTLPFTRGRRKHKEYQQSAEAAALSRMFEDSQRVAGVRIPDAPMAQDDRDRLADRQRSIRERKLQMLDRGDQVDLD
ncbi:hypothetical protein [Algivirga pacifica]|uniref:Integrase catalytic domain-containing protein n=1 Tax=Algivirga pacifica TaxID=1162670 RepID=A0ABP9D2N0_9BACT